MLGFSCHRVVEPSGLYSLGDIAVVSHSSPFYGIAVKAIKPDVLAALIGFQEVWMDEGGIWSKTQCRILITYLSIWI